MTDLTRTGFDKRWFLTLMEEEPIEALVSQRWLRNICFNLKNPDLLRIVKAEMETDSTFREAVEAIRRDAFNKVRRNTRTNPHVTEELYQQYGPSFQQALKLERGDFAAACLRARIPMELLRVWAADPQKRYQLNIVAQAAGNRDGIEPQRRIGPRGEARKSYLTVLRDSLGEKADETLDEWNQGLEQELTQIALSDDPLRDCLLHFWHNVQAERTEDTAVAATPPSPLSR